MSSTPPATWLVVLGVALWFAGIGGVTLADAQLARFKRSGDSHGRTCREGLWRYSRHPNYFFEWVHWCSYVPLAAASPWWWAPILVAAALLYFVLFVTGIPPTEAQSVASRGEDYRDYQRTTSAFVPWPPRSN
jgi:steroid 5-alpha reductase family enzyme